MQLEQKLERTRMWERRLTWIGTLALIVSVVLLPVSAGKMFGPPVQGDRGANWLSVSLGAIQVLSMIVFWCSVFVYLLRVRPSVRQNTEQLRDETVLEILTEIRQLRLDVDALKRSPRSSA